MSDHVAFTSVIKQAYKSSLKQGETSRRGPYWWTDDIAEGRAKCIAARRELTWQRRRAVDSRGTAMASEVYRTQKKELCKLIKTTKRKFCQEFCHELDNDVWTGAYRTVLKKIHCRAP
ncbi:hypothetical protein QE152_g31102 [Popillia japonica]|uniref:Reverse transcriptase n=1 Tax=Popillia japonica TaxID=7064 RepID=A0AAW1JC99_POPJA